MKLIDLRRLVLPKRPILLRWDERMLKVRLSPFFCGLLVFLFAVTLPAADESLKVHFLDVGQADAILVTCPHGQHHLLIDAGDNRYPDSAEHFRSFLTQEFQGLSNHINVVVASHMHSDHLGSMAWVLEHFQVDTYIDNGDTAETALFGNLLKLRRKLSRSGALTYVNAKRSPFATVDFCPLVKMVIFEPWAKHAGLSGKNDRSVVVRLEYRNESFLFVGDIEKAAEQVMLDEFTQDQRRLVDADVLKVGHHASDTSSTVRFINAVSPDVAVVSCGRKEVGTNVTYKHPRASTIRNYQDWFAVRLPSVQAALGSVWAYEPALGQWLQTSRPSGMWLTVKDGTVAVQTDGQRLEVETQNP